MPACGAGERAGARAGVDGRGARGRRGAAHNARARRGAWAAARWGCGCGVLFCERGEGAEVERCGGGGLWARGRGRGAARGGGRGAGTSKSAGEGRGMSSKYEGRDEVGEEEV